MRRFWKSEATPTVDSIKTMELTEIVTRSECEPDFESLCKSHDLDVFWERHLPELFTGTFTPHVLQNVDAFTQYRGYYYYNLAVVNGELANDNLDDYPNLSKSIKFGFYPAIKHAMNHVSLDVVRKLGLLNLVQPPSTSIIYLTQYDELKRHAIQLQASSESQMNPQLLVCFEQAYIALYIAESLLEYSKSAIHNASFGLGIGHLFPDFTSFDDAKNTIINLIEAQIPTPVNQHIPLLIDRARYTLNQILNTTNTTSVDGPELG